MLLYLPLYSVTHIQTAVWYEPSQAAAAAAAAGRKGASKDSNATGSHIMQVCCSQHAASQAVSLFVAIARGPTRYGSRRVHEERILKLSLVFSRRRTSQLLSVSLPTASGRPFGPFSTALGRQPQDGWLGTWRSTLAQRRRVQHIDNIGRKDAGLRSRLFHN